MSTTPTADDRVASLYEPVGISPNVSTTERYAEADAEAIGHQFMVGRISAGRKLAFAPWTDSDAEIPCNEHDDAPCTECGCDARWKWGHPANWRDFFTAQWAVREDPEYDQVVFIQQPDDKCLHVDFDDVVCPETGDIHPAAVALLAQFGLTYSDVSTSGSGIHAYYEGSLPEGIKQIKSRLDDEPWGENDDPPAIELYDGKRVCFMTGKHLDGTPTKMQPIDSDVLGAFAEAHDAFPEETANREAVDLSDWDPDDAPSTTDETTDDITDVLGAISLIDARDVAEQTIVWEWTSRTGDTWSFKPTWGPNSNGTANIVNADVWTDTGQLGGKGGPEVMALIADGKVDNVGISPQQVSGKLWWEGVDRLRDLGYDIPYYEPPSDEPDYEYTPIISKPDPIERIDTNEWNWRAAARKQAGDDPKSLVRMKTRDALEKAIEANRPKQVIEAPPGSGKTTETAKLAAELDDAKLTFLTGRGVDEQYEYVRDRTVEAGGSAFILPALERDCPAACGECGDVPEERIEKMRNRGLTPKEVHIYYERWFDDEIPCREDGECPYQAKWSGFEPDEYDIIIGHYNHGHLPTVTMGRTTVVDEFPDAYEYSPDGLPKGAITRYLQSSDHLPFDDYADLMEHRAEGMKRAEALAYYQTEGVSRSIEAASFEGGHVMLPFIVFTLLAGPGNDLGNGIEHVRFPDDNRRVGIYNRELDYIGIINPPDWFASGGSKGLVGLDATPTMQMWRVAVGTRAMKRNRVLSDDEMREYISDGLGLDIVKTSHGMKPYAGGEYVNVEQDGSLLEWVRHHERTKPSLISSLSAWRQYQEAGLDEHIDQFTNYGNVLGSNKFKEKRVGVVTGSMHYGDDYIKHWGAYAGVAVERQAIDDSKPAKGDNLSYGAGDPIHEHMTENTVYQAILRFGRDGRGARVYVHTDAIPDWVPHREGIIVKTWSDGEREVIETLCKLGEQEWTTAELAEHIDSVGKRQLRNILHTFVERGYLSRRIDGNRYVWKGTNLHRIGEFGEVEEEAVDLDAVEAEIAAEILRRSYFTWEFRLTHGWLGGAEAQQPADETVSPKQVIETDDRSGDEPPD